LFGVSFKKGETHKRAQEKTKKKGFEGEVQGLYRQEKTPKK